MINSIISNSVTRRDFLRTASLLCAGALAGRSTLRAAIAPIRRIGDPRLRLALNAYSFSKLLNDAIKQRGPGVTLLDLVDFCARQNLDGLDATGYFFPGYPKPPSDETVNTLKRRAFDSGVGISGTGVRNNFTTAEKSVREAGVEHVKEWIEVAARLGAPVLRVFADTQMRSQTWQTVAPGCTREQVEGWIAEHLRDCADHGKKCGVIVGVQNHGDFLQTGEDQLNLLKRVDSDWCGAIVDTGYYRSPDPYEDMAHVAPYAVNWQIKESPFGAESEVRIDARKLLTIVRTAGYRGYLPIETLSTARRDYDPFHVVPKFLAELRDAIEATALVASPGVAEEPPVVTAPLEPAASDRPARKPANREKRSTSEPP